MTENKYWIYLENLRLSGVTNMYGAVPYLMAVFPKLTKQEASRILSDWMENRREEDHIYNDR